VLRARPARLARLGLSAPKIRALKAIARAVANGQLALAALADAAPEGAHAALTPVHGIGPGTAGLYFFSFLGPPDAWPAGDLALQEAARLAFALPQRPSAKEMLALAEVWRPLRAVAARVLWTYYRAVKGRDGAPSLAPAPPKPTSPRVSPKKSSPQRGRNGRRA